MRSGAGETPNEAFRAIIDSVRQIDLERPRALLDVYLEDWTTAEEEYTTVLDQMVIRTSDDIATPTAIGAAWWLRADFRLRRLDARMQIYGAGDTLVQTLGVARTLDTLDVETDEAAIALSSDTTYRVRVQARVNLPLGTPTLAGFRLVEYSP